MKNGVKVIFLDIDGVLNGWNKPTQIFGDICMKNKYLKKLWIKWDIFGIRTIKVLILSIICHLSGAKVVLSSSWRGGFLKPYKENSSRMKSLKRKFKIFGIKVIGITPRDRDGIRGLEIEEWLKTTDLDVKGFVIIDDETHDIEEFFSDNIIKTTTASYQDIVNGNFENTNSGLSFKDIKKALKILKIPNDKSYMTVDKNLVF